MRDQLELVITERTENHTRVLLAWRTGSGGTLGGVLRGPYSHFSKTLTADSVFKPAAQPGRVEALVTEPCYWTPRLPFWYDLHLEWTFGNGNSQAEAIPLGWKRFYCQGRNFLLEGKRFVLRGRVAGAATSEQGEQARRYEIALIVNQPHDEQCEAASKLGVPLLVDLRNADSTAAATLHWHPAVMLALVTEEQARASLPSNVLTAVCVATQSSAPTVPCHALAIELEPGERPPAWAANYDKPVIAIRKVHDAEISSARAECDKLQADLAPEFDLAGYFV